MKNIKLFKYIILTRKTNENADYSHHFQTFYLVPKLINGLFPLFLYSIIIYIISLCLLFIV